MRVKNLSRCNSRLRKSLKESPNRTKVGNWARHLRVPIDTLGVPINTWQVLIGTSLVPIGTASRPDPETF